MNGRGGVAVAQSHHRAHTYSASAYTLETTTRVSGTHLISMLNAFRAHKRTTRSEFILVSVLVW